MTQPSLQQDQYYMTIAIELARQGRYTTRPNPCVGCVMVKDGHIVGQGYHQRAGQAHAEVNALSAAGQQAEGATVYVTLEPCAHYGRTPPCATALVAAKVKRVVIANLDPNPKVGGKGVDILKAAGITVDVGVLTDAASQLNLGFLQTMAGGRPYVRLKLATSLDGRIALKTGESKWITSTVSRQDVQRLRAESGAIITGSQTIINDEPSLTVRQEVHATPLDDIVQPLRVVIDRRGRLTPDNGFFEVTQSNIVLVSTRLKVDSFAHCAARIKVIEHTELTSLLAWLKAQQIYEVLVESGAALASSFIAADLVDEIILYQAPCFLGSTALPMLSFDISTLADQYRYRIVDVQRLGEDTRQTLRRY